MKRRTLRLLCALMVLTLLLNFAACDSSAPTPTAAPSLTPTPVPYKAADTVSFALRDGTFVIEGTGSGQTYAEIAEKYALDTSLFAGSEFAETMEAQPSGAAGTVIVPGMTKQELYPVFFGREFKDGDWPASGISMPWAFGSLAERPFYPRLDFDGERLRRVTLYCDRGSDSDAAMAEYWLKLRDAFIAEFGEPAQSETTPGALQCTDAEALSSLLDPDKRSPSVNCGWVAGDCCLALTLTLTEQDDGARVYQVQLGIIKAGPFENASTVTLS